MNAKAIIVTIVSSLLSGIVGVIISTGYYHHYENQQTKIDTFLRSQGINIPPKGGKDINSMTLKELVAEKERLEDIIAEREMSLSGAAKASS